MKVVKAMTNGRSIVSPCLLLMELDGKKVARSYVPCQSTFRSQQQFATDFQSSISGC